MNETHRNNLLSACAFAKVFIESADAELRGSGFDVFILQDTRTEAAEQLQAALEALDPILPKEQA